MAAWIGPPAGGRVVPVHRRSGTRRPRRPGSGQAGPMSTVEARACDFGRRQHGLATREQLGRVRISPATVHRRLVCRRWSEPLPGVIDLGTHPPSWHRRLQALLLAAGPSAWASHRTAAYLHGFLDVARPSRLDVVVPRGRHPRVGRLRLHTTVALGEDETEVVAGFACTAGARTLVDLAAFEDDAVLERLTLDLGRRDPGQFAQLPAVLGRRRGAAGRRRLWRVLARVPTDVARLESPLEVLGVARLVNAGLQTPQLQYQVLDSGGERLRRVDAAWPARRVAVEFDGAAYHDPSAQRHEDDRVRRAMRDLGWEVVVLRAHDLSGPEFDRAVRRIRSAGV